MPSLISYPPSIIITKVGVEKSNFNTVFAALMRRVEAIAVLLILYILVRYCPVIDLGDIIYNVNLYKQPFHA